MFPSASSNYQTVAAVWLGYCVMGGLQGCVMRGFSRNSTMVASHLMVVLLATERFIALRFPFRYQQLMLPKRVIIVAVSLYLYAVCCLALLKLYKNETNRYRKFLKTMVFMLIIFKLLSIWQVVMFHKKVIWM